MISRKQGQYVSESNDSAIGFALLQGDTVYSIEQNKLYRVMVPVVKQGTNIKALLASGGLSSDSVPEKKTVKVTKEVMVEAEPKSKKTRKTKKDS